MNKYPLSGAIENIRPLLAAGHFYPRDAETLSLRLTELAETNPPAGPITAAAALVPQGELQYAGPGLIWALQHLPLSSPKGILICARVHREADDSIWLPDYDGFETLSGTLPVPRGELEKIVSHDSVFRLGRMPFEEEPCFDLILNALEHLKYHGYVVPVLFASKKDSLIPQGQLLLKQLGPAYIPLVCTNLERAPQKPIIPGHGSENLLKLLEGHFAAAPDRWYYGNSQHYCAAIWSQKDGKHSEKSED